MLVSVIALLHLGKAHHPRLHRRSVTMAVIGDHVFSPPVDDISTPTPTPTPAIDTSTSDKWRQSHYANIRPYDGTSFFGLKNDIRVVHSLVHQKKVLGVVTRRDLQSNLGGTCFWGSRYKFPK